MSDEDPRIGTTVLEKLRIDALLGAGGMGAVYRAHHLVTKHDRALKVLHAGLAGDEGVVKRLIREAGVAGTLRSPHVVETLDVGRLEDQSPYVLMELLDGETLADRMERGDLSPEAMIGFVCQACEGIVHAHAAGIVHRDLKPDNLFIVRSAEGEERIKILDFGISKFQVEQIDDGSVTREGTILGTPLYMSPEQSIGQADLGPATDIYSLGVILYEGLCGRTPHEASTFPQLIVQLNTTRPTPLRELVPAIDPGLAAIVDKALAIKAADRQASAAALLRALAPFAEGRQVAHLDTLRGAEIPPRRPALLAMADTMAGGLVDNPRAPSSPPAAIAPAIAPAEEDAGRTTGDLDVPAAREPSRRAATERLGSEPPRAPSAPDETPEQVPRRSWVPWALTAAVAALLITAIALVQGSSEVDTELDANRPSPAIAAEPTPEQPTAAQPSLPVGLDPAAPEVAEPEVPVHEVAPRDPEPTAEPRDPEPIEEPVTRPRARPAGSGPRYDVARENPYE